MKSVAKAFLAEVTESVVSSSAAAGSRSSSLLPGASSVEGGEGEGEEEEEDNEDDGDNESEQVDRSLSMLDVVGEVLDLTCRVDVGGGWV